MKKVRPIRVEGDVAYITLTKGHIAIIDACDVPLVESMNWCSHVQKHSVYARTHLQTRPHTAYLHRMILGAAQGAEVDHRDGNGLNNRRENLRLASRSENNQNRRWSKMGDQGMRGVSFHKASRKWDARIQANGVPIRLGLFSTPEEAKAAYLKASSELHKSFGLAAAAVA